MPLLTIFLQYQALYLYNSMILQVFTEVQDQSLMQSGLSKKNHNYFLEQVNWNILIIYQNKKWFLPEEIYMNFIFDLPEEM